MENRTSCTPVVGTKNKILTVSSMLFDSSARLTVIS